MYLNNLISDFWKIIKRIFTFNDAAKNTLVGKSFVEKLISSGMDPTLANIYDEMYAKLARFKMDITYSLVDPFIRTKTIIRDISLFCEKSRIAGESQEIIDIHKETFNDFVICMIIDHFGNKADGNSINQDIKQAVVKHYTLQDYVLLCKSVQGSHK